MLFIDAEKLVNAGIPAMSDADLGEAWRAYASKISFHHADDTTREWGAAAALKPTLKALDEEHDRRGLARPSRSGWLL